jgi:hypothetical protein
MLKKGVVPSVFALTNGNQEASQCEKKITVSSNDSGMVYHIVLFFLIIICFEILTSEC